MTARLPASGIGHIDIAGMHSTIAIRIRMGDRMRTVQMTLDERLVNTVDKAAKDLHTTRSAFTRHALRQAIARFETQKLEQRHRQGYIRTPSRPGEFAVWEKEQKWGDE